MGRFYSSIDLLGASLFIGILNPLRSQVAFGRNVRRSQPKLNQTEAPKVGQSERDRPIT